MPTVLHDFLVSLTFPPTLSLYLVACGVLAGLLHFRKCGVALAGVALAWSALWSIPRLSDDLRLSLEQRYPLVDEATLPKADAIVVLGGGSRVTWLDRESVDPEQLTSSRLAAGARAWLAGKAPVIILSGGRGGGRSEAQNMAKAIGRLGIPASALLLEEQSRDTEGNARYTARLAGQHRMRRVLLVTASVHMPRALLLFRRAGLDAVPVPVPELARRATWRERWLPSRRALWRSGRALKEYAGLLALHLERPAREREGRVNAGGVDFHAINARRSLRLPSTTMNTPSGGPGGNSA